MKLNEFTFDEISVGQVEKYSRIWKEEDIISFASLSGDSNPLHLDNEYAKTTQFKKCLVHGMLVASTCSTLVGMYLPGKKCLYLSQSLVFKKPVFIGDTTETIGTVIAKSFSTKIITLHIHIKKGEELVTEGEARVQIL
jgi:3-hydroxybutyryl-CoA dehydratase